MYSRPGSVAVSVVCTLAVTVGCHARRSSVPRAPEQVSATQAPLQAPATQAPQERRAARDGWRQLREGMTMEQVTDLLGAPESTQVFPDEELWYYPAPSNSSIRSKVQFDRDSGKVNWFAFCED